MCGRWLKEDCRSVGCRCRVFTSWFDSWRRSSWGRRWKLGRWWLGPFEMLGTDFALKKNSPNQVTSSRALQLFYRATSDWIGTWQDHDKYLKVLHPLHMRRHYTNNFSCTSFFFLFFLFTQYAKGLTLRPRFLYTSWGCLNPISYQYNSIFTVKKKKKSNLGKKKKKSFNL